MFLTKLWTLVITVLFILLMGALLVATKPAEHFLAQSQESQLDMAQGFFDMVMARQNRNILDIMGKARLHSPLVKATEKGEEDAAVGKWLDTLRKKLHLNAIFVLNPKGKVVAKAGEKGYSSLEGLPEFRVAMEGYHLDNTTILKDRKGERIYWVFAVPVLGKDRRKIIGAMIGLRRFDAQYLSDLLALVGKKGIQLGAYQGNAIYAKTTESPVWEKSLALYLKHRSELEKTGFTAPIKISAGGRDYLVVLSSLRGSAVDLAREQQTSKTSNKAKSKVPDNHLYWAITWSMPPVTGTWAFMQKVVPSEVLFSGFPWALFIIVSLVLVVLGFLVSYWEVDLQINRMLDRLTQLGEGTLKLVNDQEFRGKFSSMARAVNTALEKVLENASPDMLVRSKSMDEILGEQDKSAPSLPDGGVPAPPPGGKSIQYPKMKKVTLPGQSSVGVGSAGATESAKPTVPNSEKSSSTAGSESEVLIPPAPDEDPTRYFTKVLEDFKKLKHETEGTIEGFDEQEFLDKLAKTTEELRKKLKTDRIRLTVYVRDGKAALKAAPYRSGDRSSS